MKPLFHKKTFNIHHEYCNLMEAIVPKGKQTDFVNRAIKHELERIERQKVVQNLGKLREKRQSLPKPSRPSEDIVRELREGSVNQKHSIPNTR